MSPLVRHQLRNGLRVWCYPRPGSDSVAVLLSIPVGSRHETAENNGVSHFLEHMLFTGTERWSDEQEIKDVIAVRGGELNGYTGEERTSYYAHLAAEELDVALDWLSQLVFHATLPSDKIDKEREVVFQEKGGHYGWLLNTLYDLGFGYKLDRDVRRALFPDSTLAFRVIGEDESLDATDHATLAEFYRRHYAPIQATLIVVGAVDPADLFQKAEHHFGDLEPGTRAPRPPAPADATGPHNVIIRGPSLTDQSALQLGYRTVGRLHEDYWPLIVLAEALDRQLTNDIRYKQGLVYGLWVFNHFFDDAGYIGIATRAEARNQDRIVEAVESYLAGIRRDQIPDEQINEAKSALKGKWALRTESNASLARALATWSSVDSAPVDLSSYIGAINRVTPADVARVLETYFTPERRYVGRHQPVFTVTSAAKWIAGAGLCAIALWLGLRRRRRGVAAA